jgi:hypothetical protein
VQLHRGRRGADAAGAGPGDLAVSLRAIISGGYEQNSSVKKVRSGWEFDDWKTRFVT